MASPFQTAAPFARTSAIYQPPGTQLPIAHNKLPNGVDVLDWVLTQISGPILNSAECELYGPILTLLNVIFKSIILKSNEPYILIHPLGYQSD